MRCQGKGDEHPTGGSPHAQANPCRRRFPSGSHGGKQLPGIRLWLVRAGLRCLLRPFGLLLFRAAGAILLPAASRGLSACLLPAWASGLLPAGRRHLSPGLLPAGRSGLLSAGHPGLSPGLLPAGRSSLLPSGRSGQFPSRSSGRFPSGSSGHFPARGAGDPPSLTSQLVSPASALAAGGGSKPVVARAAPGSHTRPRGRRIFERSARPRGLRASTPAPPSSA